MLDIRATITQKPKMKLYSSMATMGFVHKEVRGGINHAHTTKEVTTIQASAFSSLLGKKPTSKGEVQAARGTGLARMLVGVKGLIYRIASLKLRRLMLEMMIQI